MLTLIDFPNNSKQAGPYYIVQREPGLFTAVSLREPHINPEWTNCSSEELLITLMSVTFGETGVIYRFTDPATMLDKASLILTSRLKMQTGEHNPDFDKSLDKDDDFRQLQKAHEEMGLSEWPEWVRDMY